MIIRDSTWFSWPMSFKNDINPALSACRLRFRHAEPLANVEDPSNKWNPCLPSVFVNIVYNPECCFGKSSMVVVLVSGWSARFRLPEWARE